MKVSVQVEPFAAMLDKVTPSEQEHPETISIVARYGRVSVCQSGFSADAEAKVLRDGQCVVSKEKLQGALSRQTYLEDLALETLGRSLRVGKVCIPLLLEATPFVPAALASAPASDLAFSPG